MILYVFLHPFFSLSFWANGVANSAIARECLQTDFETAAIRTCDVQHNSCADAANASQRASRAAERVDDDDADDDDDAALKQNPHRTDRDERKQQVPGTRRGRKRGDRRQAPPPPPPDREGGGGAFTVALCDQQKQDCKSWQVGVEVQSFGQENLGPDPGDGGFDLVCDVDV